MEMESSGERLYTLSQGETTESSVDFKAALTSSQMMQVSTPTMRELPTAREQAVWRFALFYRCMNQLGAPNI